MSQLSMVALLAEQKGEEGLVLAQMLALICATHGCNVNDEWNKNAETAPFLRLLMHPSQLIHFLCLAVLAIVIYENTPQGNVAFLLPVLFMGFSLAAAGMYRGLSRRALIADAIASASITGAVSILVAAGPVSSTERTLLNALILIGAIAIAVQIRFNVADRRK